MAAPELIAHENLRLEHDPDQQRYSLYQGDTFIGFLQYEQDGDVVDLRHTIIKEEYSRRGYARALVTMVLDEIDAADQKFIPTCTYIQDYVRRYPERAGRAVS